MCTEGVMSLERELDTYSKLVLACNDRVQMMHSLSFNNEQCQYLGHTLKEVSKSLNVALEPSHGALIESYAPTELEKLLLCVKLFYVLATEIERFIGGCSQDAWVPVAMTLTNVLEFVSSMGFHLELCRFALSKDCEALRGLNLDQVANISKNVNEIVKTKASIDKEDLLKKISLALPSLHGDKKDLASYLLQRLLSVAPIPSIPLPESKQIFSRYLTLLRSIFEKVNQGVSIGRGSSATVYKAKWLEMEVAVKVFNGESNPEFKKEVDVLARLCHPNITSMFCCTEEGRKCSIVMELMDGDLFTLMQHRLEKNSKSPPFNIWEAINRMHQIAEGGKYLHEQGVVHRDLKSLNILVKSVKTPDVDLEYIQAKVADFNVSKIKKGSTTHSEQTMNVGSNRWMAPELIQLRSVDNQMNVEGSTSKAPMYPRKFDIYSFAMVCYEILTGELPFLAYSKGVTKKMKAMILEGERPKLPAHCPLELRDLIEKCWNPKPKNRPTFDDICRELKFVKYLLMAGLNLDLQGFTFLKVLIVLLLIVFHF